MSAPAASGDRQLQSVPRHAEEALWFPLSAEFITDTSIPFEIRALVALLAGQRLADAKRLGEDYRNFGREAFAIEIDVPTMRALTGWPKNKMLKVLDTARALGMITRTGSPRVGYVYTVTTAVRTARANAGKASPSLFARATAPPTPRAKKDPQLQLTTDTASIPAPKAREIHSEASDWVPLPDAKPTDCIPQPDLVHYALRPATGLNEARCFPLPDVKPNALEVRARSPESLPQNITQKLLADGLDPAFADARNPLLLMAQKREPETTVRSLTFVNALDEITQTLMELCGKDPRVASDRLVQILADPRVANHPNPIAALRLGLCREPRYLLRPRVVPTKRPSGDEQLFLALPEAMQAYVLDRAALGESPGSVWFKERDVPVGAARFALSLVRKMAPVLPPVTEPKAPKAAPTPTTAVDVAATVRSDSPLVAALKLAARPLLSRSAYGAVASAIAATTCDNERCEIVFSNDFALRSADETTRASLVRALESVQGRGLTVVFAAASAVNP